MPKEQAQSSVNPTVSQRTVLGLISMETINGKDYMDTNEAKVIWGLRDRDRVSSYCRKYKDALGAIKNNRGDWRIPISAIPPVTIGSLRRFLFDYLKSQNSNSDFLYGDDLQTNYWDLLAQARIVTPRNSGGGKGICYIITEQGWDFLLSKTPRNRRFAISISLLSLQSTYSIASL